MRSELLFFRIKMIFLDKATMILTGILIAILLVVINQLSIGAQEKSNVSIGIVDLDRTNSSGKLAEKIKEINVFQVYENTEEKLMRLLEADTIQAYFVVEKGYERSVKTGNTKEIITMHYLEGNRSAKVISDIFAGEMLYDICLNKAFHLYDSIKWSSDPDPLLNKKQKILNWTEYEEYTDSLKTSGHFNFAFDIKLKNIKNNRTIQEIKPSLIYRQVILGITAMLFSFIAMIAVSGFVKEKEIGLDKRMKLTQTAFYITDVSYLLAGLCLQSIPALILCSLFQMKIEGFTLQKSGALFAFMIAFSWIMDLFFLALGKIIKSVDKYQFFGALSILALGFMGFLSMLKGFLSPSLLNIFKIIPNNWFIQGFTDIILYKSLQDIPLAMPAHFGTAVIALTFINIVLNRRQRSV